MSTGTRGTVGDDDACPYFWPIGDRHTLLHFSHMSSGYATRQCRGPGSALVALQPHPQVRSAGDVPVNERQRRLIDQLANGGRPKAGDVAAHFGVA